MNFLKSEWPQGNPIYLYLIFLLIVFVSIVVGMILKRLGKGKFKKMAEKSKTKLDDVIASIFEAPLNLFATTFGLYIGFSILKISNSITIIVKKGLLIIMIFVIIIAIAKLIDQFFALIVFPRVKESESKIDDQVAVLIKKTLIVLLWIFSVLIIISNLGFDVLSLLTGLGLGGLAIAMAAKDTLANIFGGITIFLDRPFHIGDLVTVNNFTGFVEDIGLRATRIRTFDNHLVSIPNATTSSSAIENISARPDMRVRFNLGLAYSTTTDRFEFAEQLIIDVILSIKGVNTDKKPTVHFLNFGASSLDFQITYYIIDTDNAFAIKHTINTLILKSLNENNFEIPFTTYTIQQVQS